MSHWRLAFRKVLKSQSIEACAGLNSNSRKSVIVQRNDEDQIRLVYCSSAREEITEADLKSIMRQAETFNGSRDIGGVLCYGGGSFIQILEGPEKDVLQLYARILDDPRHHSIRLINISITRQRCFRQWAMGWLSLPVDGDLAVWKLANYRQRSLPSSGVGLAIFKEIISRLKSRRRQ